MSPSGFRQNTLRYHEAVGAQHCPNHHEAVGSNAVTPGVTSGSGSTAGSSSVSDGMRAQARVTEALVRLGVVTLEVPRVPGSAPFVVPQPTLGRPLRAPEAVAAPTLTQRRAPKSRSSWCQPPARCPAVSGDDEAHKFAGPAPSRPAGLAARRRRRAWRDEARKCRPAA